MSWASDSLEAGAVVSCAACRDLAPVSERAEDAGEVLGVDADARVCPACLRWTRQPVALRVVARELARDCVTMLRAKCVATVLRTLPADAADRRHALGAVSDDIRAARWFGANLDGRDRMVAVVSELRDGRAINAALLLASIDYARPGDESPADFAARHLRTWADEQGADLGGEVLA